MNTQIPNLVQIILHKISKQIELKYEDDRVFKLSCEYLRVFSPSAEVRGHGNSEGVLITGKEQVNILSIEPVGNYAVKFIFSDGHMSGIYSFATLYDLAINQETNWQHYQERVKHEQI